MTRLGALVIHGMGSQESDFAKGLIRELSNRLGSDAARVEWQSIHWSPILRVRQDGLTAKMAEAKQPDGSPLPLGCSKTRRFVLHKLGDAVAYQRDSSPTSAGSLVHKRISDDIVSLKGRLNPDAPIVVLAHSLGGHMMSNYIWDRQREERENSVPEFEPLPTFLSFISFGCNIPLFGLAYDKAKPIDLPGRGITTSGLIDAARWLNYLDRHDVLGWPLKPLYAKDLATLTPSQCSTVDRIEDREINVGIFPLNLTPLSHDWYWKDNAFTAPVADHLKRIIALL